MVKPAPDVIRALRAQNPKPHARDFAALHDMTEADLLAAHIGHGATAITADPDRLVPLIGSLGDVLALTRNESCVHERRGIYSNYHAGSFAAMVLDPEIDLRIFPAHWVHAFAFEDLTGAEPKRSIQIFDAAGDAVHKVHLKPASHHDQFAPLVAALRSLVQTPMLQPAPRMAAIPARGTLEGAPALRAAWNKMTDTHQFLNMVKKQQMNRLGSYRVAGPPYAELLQADAVTAILTGAAQAAIPVMIFVGNMGCIQIHSGLIDTIVPMGPWINIMDPRFNLHLRADKIAEVYRVWKPTRTGDVHSIEAFDRQGELIIQIFGYRKNTPAEPWNRLVAALPELKGAKPEGITA